jgi:TRAP-type C4-dicarboxylate transport system permease small subunit
VRGLVEYNEVALVILIYGSLAYTQRHDGHVATTVVAQYLRPNHSRIAEGVGLSVAFVVLVWMVYSTGIEAWSSFVAREFRFGMAAVPIWPARLVLVAGLLILTLEVAVTMIDKLDIRGEGAAESDYGEAQAI